MQAAFTIVLTLVAAGIRLNAQTPAADPAFDVVSIKRSTALSNSGGGGPRPGGRYVLTNVPARSLIAIAYGVPSDRILALPAWAAEERYNIDARAPHPNPTDDELGAMLRTLLRERFELVMRRETRDLPVYSLVVARPDGARGPRLRKPVVDCADPEARKKAAATAAAGSFGGCGFRHTEGRLEGRGLSLDTLAQILVGPAGRPVIDRTRLRGSFDVDLEWAATLDAMDAVPIFTAIQEQLGLRLQSDTAPMDVVIVEKVERPMEN